MDTFKDKLPDTLDFQVGYLTKKGNCKRWIEQDADLASMYTQCEGSETITIFCDGKSKEVTRKKHKQREDGLETIRNHEEEIKQVACDLKERHGEQWNKREYQIWARMHVNNQWDSLDEPPDIPIITGGTGRRTPKKESFADAISGAAVAFANILTKQNSSATQPTTSTAAKTLAILSPNSKARLSSQYITQLKELQLLRESGVLCEEEFQEQKRFALENLRFMNKVDK